MNIPVGLKHKPVVVAENYEQVDGRYSPESDAKGLSLGLAQWNDRGKVEISAKVWRHTGGKWSRQSEELPLHRVLDLALLIAQARLHMKTAYQNETPYNKDNPNVATIPLQGDALRPKICTDNPMIDQDIDLFQQCLSQDDELISERLRALANLLREQGY